jgi:hypothetical protein
MVFIFMKLAKGEPDEKIGEEKFYLFNIILGINTYSLHPKISIILASGTVTKKHQSRADFQLTTTHARCPFHFPCACTAYHYARKGYQ